MLVLVFLLFSCAKEQVDPVGDKLFAPGDVIVIIHPDVATKDVFALMNQNGVTIETLSGFFYFSSLPNDSLSFVIDELTNKAYLNGHGFTGGSAFVSKADFRITVIEFFFNMDITAQNDWLKTMDVLKLQPLQNTNRVVYVKVMPGTETLWVERFEEHPYVKAADLNWYAELM